MPQRLPYLLFLWLLQPLFPLHAQLPVHNPVPASYDLALKRMLVINAGAYLYAVSQGQLDEDSALFLTCAAYRLSTLLPFNEDYAAGKDYPGQALLDAGKPVTAAQQLPALQGNARLQLLAELGLYYLHRPGTRPPDMDSAAYYIARLQKEAIAGKAPRWQIQGLWMQGDLDHNTGRSFEKAAAIARTLDDPHLLTLALVRQTHAMPPGAPGKEALMTAALHLSRQTGRLIDEYQVTVVMLVDHLVIQPAKLIPETQHLLALEKKMGFLHHQYAYSSLAHWYIEKGEIFSARRHAEAAITSMEQTRDTVFSPSFCIRMAQALANEGDTAAALYWNNRALNVPLVAATQVLWFKGFLNKLGLLAGIGRNQDALALSAYVYKHHAPTTDFDKMHLALRTAVAYDNMGQNAAAQRYYQRFLNIAEKYPSQYGHTEAIEAYQQTAEFYYRTGRYALARRYANRILDNAWDPVAITRLLRTQLLLFRLDSAAGDYISAIRHFQLQQQYRDSVFNITQHRQLEELKIQYQTRQKDQDIRLLQQASLLQQSKLSRSVLLGTIALAGVTLLLIIVGLLFNQYRIKQKANRQTLLQNETLRQLVDEKEWLLREVHHRVKNNLQTIVSLLESQSNYLHDDALLAVQDSQNRIYAMSLIHQQLYQHENIAAVNMNDYLVKLVHHLHDCCDATQDIHFDLDVQDTELDVSQAIPLGLIVNEAVTNAIKYAFPGQRRNNRIRLTFHIHQHQGVLTIADNGIGTAPGILQQKAAGLGLKLMQGLSKDIDAQFQLHSNNGTIITITFAAQAPLDNQHTTPQANFTKMVI